nr:MAG TPA: hypothetical protein [Caudoviricetes sp.]
MIVLPLCAGRNNFIYEEQSNKRWNLLKLHHERKIKYHV